MKNVKIITIALGLLLTGACSNDDNGSTPSDTVLGIITLSGEETDSLGETLTVVNIAVGNKELTGTTESVILLDKSSEVNEDGLVVNNLQNSFIIIAADFSDNPDADKTISMNIVADGAEYKHACSVPAYSFTDCGAGYDIDFDGKEISFVDTKVINTKTDAILTMNGTIKWD